MFHAYLATFWRFYVLILTPILLVPIVLHGLSSEKTFLDVDDIENGTRDKYYKNFFVVNATQN